MMSKKQILSVAIVALLNSAVAFAYVPIGDVVPGARYSISGMGSNRTAVAVKINREQNNVLVRYDDNGRTAWVSSSRLLQTYSDSFSDDLGETAMWGVAGLALLCAFDAECRDSMSSTSAVGNTYQPSSSANGYEIKFENNCRKDVRLAIHYKDGGTGQWKSLSWWNFESGESSYLASNNRRIKTNNATLYYYAISSDGRTEWTGADYYTTINGMRYGMREIKDTQGETDWSITCTS